MHRRTVIPRPPGRRRGERRRLDDPILAQPGPPLSRLVHERAWNCRSNVPGCASAIRPEDPAVQEMDNGIRSNEPEDEQPNLGDRQDARTPRTDHRRGSPGECVEREVTEPGG